MGTKQVIVDYDEKKEKTEFSVFHIYDTHNILVGLQDPTKPRE